MRPQSQLAAQHSAPDEVETRDALWAGTAAVLVATGLAFLLYWWTAAPGLTWAHQGADGGDFLAAAVSNGVPHPSGYPLYTILLRVWLWLGAHAAPDLSPARMGNLLSALFAALSVGVTAAAAAKLLDSGRERWWLAAAVALLWAASPLFWGQAVITEVYALHLLLATALICLILYRPGWLFLIGLLLGLGIANHLTTVLLIPAAAYLLWRRRTACGMQFDWRSAGWLLLGITGASSLYLRIPVAAGAERPPPVNWGYADNWDGFWWLISGAAYRAYFADQTWGNVGLRLAAWARSLTFEYTPAGLALAAVGLAAWDRVRPDLRNFSLLWIVPVSVYSILYATADSRVYLLPVMWMAALWIGAGTAAVIEWLPAHAGVRRQWCGGAAVGLLLLATAVLLTVRLPKQSLRHDDEAIHFLVSVVEGVVPDSIVVSSSDAETFAVWYGAWGSGELLARAPGAIIVNDSLYQFEWYRRLLADLYPDVAGIGDSLQALLDQNAGSRPIFFVEQLDSVPAERQKPAGDIWQYIP